MGELDSWRLRCVDGIWAHGFGASIRYIRYPDGVLRHVGSDHDWSRCLDGTKGAVEMRSIVIATVVLVASIAGAVEAASVDRRYKAPDIHSELVRLPARTITKQDGKQYQFFGWADRTTYTKGLPARKTHGFWGFRGLEFRGLPPWLQEVETDVGRDLIGSPQPGTFTIQMYLDGKHIPSLDMPMTFIPR